MQRGGEHADVHCSSCCLLSSLFSIAHGGVVRFNNLLDLQFIHIKLWTRGVYVARTTQP